MRRLLLFGLLAVAPAIAEAQDNAAGRAKMAEMMAFIRLASEACEGSIPAAWGFEALSLYMLTKPPITEEEIGLKEKEVEQLRTKLGDQKWCQLYAVQMKEAHFIFDLASGGKLQ